MLLDLKLGLILKVKAPQLLRDIMRLGASAHNKVSSYFGYIDIVCVFTLCILNSIYLLRKKIDSLMHYG